jgi:hypothetical protein
MRIHFDTPPSLAARIIAAVLALLAAGAALMFSVVILAGLALAGLAFWGWFWWKTRALRRSLREETPTQRCGTPADHRSQAGVGKVIEGEAVRVMEEGRLTENTEKTEGK